MGKSWCFFSARQLSFQPASRSSSVRSPVVRCLCFNPEVPCSNQCVYTNFFKHSKAEGSPFPHFQHWDSPTFSFVRHFFESFWMSPNGPLLFFDILQQNGCQKSQTAPFRFFLALWDSNSHFFPKISLQYIGKLFCCLSWNPGHENSAACPWNACLWNPGLMT